ncbi:dermonecrotic toxin domain-containing protein [Pseudomonas sp. B22129]|uniref:dermonecrotic toxin domain-containing protein n=1 Tax=Pseudomonas sp. B22129 TaxID=3235111 RepID=UPI003784011E
MSTPSAPHDAGQPDSHYDLLTNAIPPWLGQASSARQQALAQTTPQPHPTQAEFKRLSDVHGRAQTAVDDALKQVQGPRVFARTLLEEALKTRYGLVLDSETVYLRLYIPQHVPWFSIPTGAARTWTVSLLDAALHNFEHGETLAGAFEADSTFITQPDANGQFDTLPDLRQTLGIATFTGLCRELDIGAQYQTYLSTQLGQSEPVSAAVLQTKVDASQKAALRAALQLARQRGDIQEDFAREVEGLLQGRSNLALRGHTLQMMDAPLTGILLLAPNLETTRSVQRLVAYVPDDPQHPLKEYASALAFKQALTRQLREPDYQTFFSRFVAHEHRGLFFANLSQRLARIKWHPPEYGSGLAAWRKEPTDDPKLQFVATPIQGDVWHALYQQKLNKILNDARTQAVSTATVDRNARWALWDSFVNVASSILNTALLIVAPFIPGLGELMLGYMAWQLLDEVFEGIVDWAEGLPQEAFGHLMSVLQSLVQLGAFGAGSTIGAAELRKVLPADVLAFIDRFKPVTLANGAKRYWKPDLTAYRQDITVPARLGTDAQGLNSVRGESILPLENHLYAVQKTADDRYVIKHPTRSDAYTPRLQHNGAGAWHSELDSPLRWDQPTLLRRLGQGVSQLSEADRQLALDLSGTPENALRKMHVRGDPVPPLLDDTFDRLRIDRDLNTLIERLDSDDPAQHAHIDPQDLLHVLTAYGGWPATRALRMLDAAGNTVWTFGDMNQPVVQVHEAQLANGELLKTVLQTLSPEEIRAQFGERAADPQLSLDNRVKQLRKKLARLAEAHRTELFDTHYAQLQPSPDGHTQQMMQTAPGLPAKVITRLLDQASAAELEELDAQRTPPRLAHLAEDALAEVRLNRAYDGLHVASAPNIDSERLALNTLKLLPGWSGLVRLQATHLDPAAPGWLQVGPQEAPIRRTLVRTAAGRYVPHDDQGPLFGETDLYTAILNALPDAQRDALGIGIGQGSLLKQRLRHNPLKRDELRQVLGGDALRPPPRETLRHLGSDSGYPALTARAAQLPSLEERAAALFPQINQQQIADLLNHLHNQPGGTANNLAALAEEYRQLDRDLTTWEQQPLDNHPDTGQPLSSNDARNERRNRKKTAKELRRCWRRETEVDHYFDDPAVDGHTLRLEYPTLASLPALTANFEHVSLLTLSGYPQTLGADAFLGRFQRLRHLTIQGFNLGTPPEAIFNLPRLNTLSLSNCNLRLTPATQSRISGLQRLQSLTLHNNPLGLAPSVEAMPHLIHLDLSHTAIEQFPQGLLNHPELQVALLNDNRIRELPAALFTSAPEVGDKYDLGGNPLSRTAMEEAKTYFHHHGTYFEIDAPASDLRDAHRLYPSMNRKELSRLIYGLPGTLEAGQVELARLAAELQTLQTQLAQWEQAPGLAPEEFARRIALRRLLESSWRHELTEGSRQPHSLIITRYMAGELPTLDAAFRHISWLMIEDNDAPINIDSFLGSFPNVQVLNLNRATLNDIPHAVFTLRKLWFLELENCAITLSADSRASLERMPQLKHLSLVGNPVGELPDFSRMPNLVTLLLQRTGLTEVPTSLLTQTPRQIIKLSHNAIEQVPAELLALPANLAQAFDLAANPLARPALEQVKRHCQRTGEFFNIQVPIAQRERARRLYPNVKDREKDNEKELNRIVFGLPGSLDDIDTALGTLEADYQQLVADLQRWVNDAPAQHPLLGGALDDITRIQEEANRNRIKDQLQRAWRREIPEDGESLDDRTSYALVLDTPIIGALPDLRASFEHVTSFELKGTFTLTGMDGTLSRFTALQTLIVSHCTLNKLPSALFSMPGLATLDLSDCAIRLSPAEARAISDLHTLEYLDLSNNPLGHAPDVSQLQQLNSLHLPNTQISEMPAGVFLLPELHNLDLSGNQIREVPAALLEGQQTFDDDSDFRGNPWSLASLRRLRAYYLRTGIDFQIVEITLEGNGDVLVPQPEEPMEE